MIREVILPYLDRRIAAAEAKSGKRQIGRSRCAQESLRRGQPSFSRYNFLVIMSDLKRLRQPGRRRHGALSGTAARCAERKF
jgi:hypothetical protein